MHMPFIYTFIMFHLAFSPSLTIKNFFSQTWVEYEQNSVLVEKWKGKEYRLVIQRQKRMDGELDLWEGEYTYRCILTNDHKSSEREIVEFYNLRGGKERIFDDMNNGFGWNRLPKSFMGENTVFLLLRHSYETSINSSWRGLMQRSSDSRQQAASRRLSSSSSLVYCSTLSLQKKFLENLLHFLHPSEKPVVFTRDFGCRIGCRIRCRM